MPSMTIPDAFSKVVDAVRARSLPALQEYDADIQTVRFEWGHIIDLQEALQKADTRVTIEEKLSKFPLIWLVYDVAEQSGRNQGWYAELSLRVIIAHITKQDYTPAMRQEKVYKPILHPLYYTLMEELSQSWHFTAKPPKLLERTKYDRIFWGRDSGNGGSPGEDNKLPDYVDAIDIQNLQVKLNFDEC